MINKDGFLMIEPIDKRKKPIVDDLTKKVTAILRRAKEVAHYKGSHTCVCGAKSGSAGLEARILGNRLQTNSLIVHYIACHRDEIPKSQMRLIKSARYASREDPTEKEIRGRERYA